MSHSNNDLSVAVSPALSGGAALGIRASSPLPKASFFLFWVPEDLERREVLMVYSCFSRKGYVLVGV
jgi:hypothetical protein